MNKDELEKSIVINRRHDFIDGVCRRCGRDILDITPLNRTCISIPRETLSETIGWGKD